MNAVAALAVARGRRLVRLAEVSGAMSLEALKGPPTAFDARIRRRRPHRGQSAAVRLRRLLADSEIRASHREHDSRVQEAYGLRCMPQVHGALRDGLDHGAAILQIESGTATDNPLIFPEAASGIQDGGEVLEGGNFHGAP
jgi:histidine ammonia-lyase